MVRLTDTSPVVEVSTAAGPEKEFITAPSPETTLLSSTLIANVALGE
jgi:hypothetical protein